MHLEQIAHHSALYAEACALRDAVLREPLHMQLSKEDIAGEESQFHCVARDENGVVVGTVLLKPLTEHHVKLRQMAVATALHGQGIGAKLVHFAEALARHHGFMSIECNARCYASGFYKKLGYWPEGEIFMEVGLPTVKMGKALV
jgi:predicted GNAT family N-acyltransferase